MPLSRFWKIWNIGIVLVFLAYLAEFASGYSSGTFSAGAVLGMWTIMALNAGVELIRGKTAVYLTKSEMLMLGYSKPKTSTASIGPGTH